AGSAATRGTMTSIVPPGDGRAGAAARRPRPTGGLEEALRRRGVGPAQVLRLLVVLEHHEVVLAPDAGLLVPAERRVRRVLVVGVRPHPPGLDGTPGPVHRVGAAAPHPGPEAVEGVVGDGDGVVEVLERRHGEDRAEDLLLEHPHPVVALEDRRLDVEATVQALDPVDVATDEDLGTLLPADVEVALDLL